MKEKFIWTVVTLFFGIGTYLVGENIHNPVPPTSVSLPLGEQNRFERLIISGGYSQISEPYVEKLTITPETLPKDAWCDQYGTYPDKLILSCYWATPNEATRFAAGHVTIDNLPMEDVWGWKFNRDTLTAEPEMYSWVSVNFGYVIFTIVMGLITIVTLGVVLFARSEEAKPKFGTT